MIEIGYLYIDLNGMMFSILDRDNDWFDFSNCVFFFCGGWWFNVCYSVYLIGFYKIWYVFWDFLFGNIDKV